MAHTFHIPVLGLGYSVDTPLKVARYGIPSVISIVDDILIERMRQFHTPADECFTPINTTEPDYRAKRITAYLNLVSQLVDQQHQDLKKQEFAEGSDLTRYFDLLPDHCDEKQLYLKMLAEPTSEIRVSLQNVLKEDLRKGAIDVNIMAKVDKFNYAKEGDPLDDKFSDALAALRGYAGSELNSSLIISAGMNPRLYSYLEEFAVCFPNGNEPAKKKIILKVSDFRSAFIQAKFLAKKGIWVHEFRIESGLNCGGHAFATEGYLLGPILEEFKERKSEMIRELYEGYSLALLAKGIGNQVLPETRITVQGGIGTAEENQFLQRYYQVDGTGWGSPFLLVPEATNVDPETLKSLSEASEDDFYISDSSPLGIPFNNFRKSSAEKQRLERIDKGRPGSPCVKKYLVSNTEFTEHPICTASREYQNLKLKQLASKDLSEAEYQDQYNSVTEKICLCEGLCSSTYIKDDLFKPRENRAVTICPGPNTAYFNGVYSLDEMVKHIYGKVNLLMGVNRPHMFAKELTLYISYLKKDIEQNIRVLTDKKAKQLERFKNQLLTGIEYYAGILPEIPAMGKSLEQDLVNMKQLLSEIVIPEPSINFNK